MAELYLVEFKGSRKEYFLNTYYHSLNLEDYVIVQAERGEEIGILSKKIEVDIDFSEKTKPRSILRPSSPDDRTTYEETVAREKIIHEEVIEMISRHRLEMKVVDVECQFDGNKITVFFSALSVSTSVTGAISVSTLSLLVFSLFLLELTLSVLDCSIGEGADFLSSLRSS